MDVEAFCRQSHVVVVVGKGGVGKTTVTAALARVAARAGLDVLVAALDDSGGLPAMFAHDGPTGYEEVLLAGGERSNEGSDDIRIPGRMRARVLTSDGALLEYLSNHAMGRISRRLIHSGTLDVIATAIPGIREVLVLGKLRNLEENRAADLIILDAPATGHAFTFLTSSRGLVDTARGGPLRAQAEQVVTMLADPARAQVLLVTVPEETPMNELIETAYRVEDEVGVALGPIVINCCYRELAQLDADPAAAARAAGVPAPSFADDERLAGAATFRARRQELQREQFERLNGALPLPQMRLPLLFSAGVGPVELETLADALALGIESLPT